MSRSALLRLPAGCSVGNIVEACEADGGVVVERWLSASFLQRLNAELVPWLEQHKGTDSGSAASDGFLGLKTRRLQGLTVKAPAFVDLLTDPRLVGFAEATLAPISPNVILNNGEVIDIGPGENAQPLHRDDDAWNFANADNTLMINTIAALVDVTPEMGATLVVPGSHRWPADRTPSEAEIVSCELAAGSALFFRGDTLHAGGANTTNKRRRVLSTGLCCGWLRPVENSYTNVPVDTVRNLPLRAQQLLGYELYDASHLGGGYLGYHDMSDPMKLLR